QLRALLGLPGAVEFLRQAVQPRQRVVEAGRWIGGLFHGSVRAWFAPMPVQPRSGWIAEPGVAQRTPGQKAVTIVFPTAKRLYRRTPARRYNRFAVYEHTPRLHFPGVRCATPGCSIQPLRG